MGIMAPSRAINWSKFRRRTLHDYTAFMFERRLRGGRGAAEMTFDTFGAEEDCKKRDFFLKQER